VKNKNIVNHENQLNKNSDDTIFQNFLGSLVQISKVLDVNGREKEEKRNVNEPNKMGPIQLKLEEGNSLY